MENTLDPALDNTRRCRPNRFNLLHVKTVFMKSEGEEAVELSLERMKTTRSSGRHSKRSFFFLVCLNGALMLAFKLVTASDD